MTERLIIALLIGLLAYMAFAAFRARHLRRASAVAEGRGTPAILYFRSDACAPCVTQSRFLEQVRAEFGDHLMIEKVDADVEPARAEKFGVFTLPTTLIMDGRGRVRHVNYGLTDVANLRGQLRALERAA